jgi:uncharacterized protein HemX
MRGQSSRFTGSSRRAGVAAALVVAGLGVGAAGCGEDDEEGATKSVDEAIESIQKQSSTAIDQAQEQAQSVQSEADQALEQAQKKLEEQQQDGDGDGGGGNGGY